VPLPRSPLKITNSYFLRGDDRNLLIDTGFNHELSRTALDRAVEKLAIDMTQTDIFITHLHSDHAGLCRHIQTPDTRILMSRIDGEYVAAGQQATFWEGFNDFYGFTGLRAGGYVTDIADHPGYAFAPPAADDITPVSDGDVIRVGDWALRAILTPGHTPGHLCLYDEAKRVLFSGDHILGTITPNITQVSFRNVALHEYLASLDHIATLDVDVVYPGHRKIITDCRGRIADLKNHHEKRLGEVLAIVGDRRVTTVDVAKEMRWSLTIRDWLDYPPAQKIFSAGEALAHLYYLTVREQLTMDTDADGVVHFAKRAG
ncbi:MAG: MBL fold metallo-hydrolase, partial [Planctomycetes bacterium]|nr:MBL fold metallo-hydrolase [Planctomycetota bacterium]